MLTLCQNMLLFCEFFVLYSLKSDLYVWPADQELNMLLQDDAVRQYREDSWRILNDALLTDAPLLFAPHVIALACLFLAAHKDKVSFISSASHSCSHLFPGRRLG